jgi:hypothetical protein
MTTRRFPALALAALMLAGCSVQLRTAPAPVQGCDEALGSGRLVASTQSGLALADGSGRIMPVLWPFGYTARRDATGIALIGQKGEVLAKEGDFVQAAGGTGADGFFAVCDGTVRVVPPSG